MPARDLYHDQVKNALIKDGWRITHNALRLRPGSQGAAADLDEEEFLGAEKDERKIAVAIKSFVGLSDAADVTEALGQLALSRTRLHATEHDRVMYLAVRQTTYGEFFAVSAGQRLVRHQHLPLIVFDPRTEMIVQWLPGGQGAPAAP